MKREIICPECREELRKIFPTDTPFPGEYVRFVDGHARKPFICDNCGADIPHGLKCTALSMWTDNFPYTEWENDYIAIKG